MVALPRNKDPTPITVSDLELDLLCFGIEVCCDIVNSRIWQTGHQIANGSDKRYDDAEHNIAHILSFVHNNECQKRRHNWKTYKSTNEKPVYDSSSKLQSGPIDMWNDYLSNNTFSFP